MTNDSGHSDGKGGGQPPISSTAAPDGARRNNVLPIDRGRGIPRRPWPISASGLSLNSGAGLLIVIGILCGLLISESDRKSPIAGSKPGTPAQVQASATTQAAAPTQKPVKPSPAIRAGATARSGDPAPAKQPGNRPSNRGASFTPAKFEATHKKVFGGCTGELELTSSGLHFRCPKAELDFPIDEIARANKDGVVLKSGEKYHFSIANHTKDQAEAIFTSWLSRVQPAMQQSSPF
ncbi:MAG: hypothetical protein JOZ33_13805 [Acidobacteriaceae bacterium]|nr:hypothetical protein [Acidobacteriaceae bacterium]